MLADYDRIVPGAAGRIVAMAETQSVHRQHLEKSVIEANIRAARRGQYFALALGMTAIVGGFYLMAQGVAAYGLAAVITAIATLAGVFVYGRHKEEKERAKKAEALPRQLQ